MFVLHPINEEPQTMPEQIIKLASRLKKAQSKEKKTGPTLPKNKASQSRVLSKEEKLNKLYAQYSNCIQCPLASQGRTQVVFGFGNINAQIMFIGEAPGKEEDINGKPFIGRAGQLLTKILETTGLTRNQVYISNIVKCRPPGNRTPLPNERTICKNNILLKEIKLIDPVVICTLGAAATQGLLGDETTISQARGNLYFFEGYKILPTYHPAYLLRNPSKKRIVEEDLQKVMRILEDFKK